MTKNNNGLSLMELVLSTFVISTIMLGIMSAYNTLYRQSTITLQSSVAVMTAQSILTYILNDAYEAVGTSSDLGVRIGAAGTGHDRSFCFRKSMSPALWSCYTKSGADMVVQGNLFTCQRSTPSFCRSTDTGYRTLGLVRFESLPAFTTDNTQGSSRMLFSLDMTIQDRSESSGRRVIQGSVSPPAHVI